MDSLNDFYNHHKGETCLIVGNGPSLNDIPDELLEKYISFGCNRIWERYEPTYYFACDSWVPEENPFEYCSLRSPIFVPSPGMDEWGADYRFKHRPGTMWLKDVDENYLNDPGIQYIGTPHAMLQVAYFMGFQEFLLVGMDNTGGPAHHFYEFEEDDNREVDPELWDWGFGLLKVCFTPRVIVNLSTHTTITNLPRANWQNFL